MSVSTKLPVASGGPVAILSIIEYNSCRFLNAIELHCINKLSLSRKHVRVLVRHVTEIVQVDEYGVRQMTLMEVDDIVISSHGAVYYLEVDVAPNLNHLIYHICIHKYGLIELSQSNCGKNCYRSKLFSIHIGINIIII